MQLFGRAIQTRHYFETGSGSVTTNFGVPGNKELSRNPDSDEGASPGSAASNVRGSD